MDSISWQDKDKASKVNRKPRVTQSYDDDFEQENTTKKPGKQIDLPKIGKDIVGQSLNKVRKAIIEDSEDDPYGDDFQQSSNKKLPFPQKVATKMDNKNQKFSPQVNSKGSNPYEESDYDGVNERKVRQTSNKKPESKPQNSPPLNIKKKSVSSSHVKRSLNPTQVLTKKPSQSVIKNNSIQLESKYIGYLKAEFPHTKQEVFKFPPQKINRLNQKLRGYIKKVNDELTDLINENMRLIKLGTLQTKSQGKSVDDVIRVLTEQKKNGETYIETVEKQCYNLAEQWDKIRDGEVERNTEQQIRQITQKIKEYTKQIGNLKYGMKSEGNKLTAENNYAERIAQLKSKFAIMKREEEKYTEKLQKCEKNAEELTEKTPQIDAQLEKLIQQAKQEKITLNFNPSDRKKQQKYEELKKKTQNIRLHKDKTQGLCESKTAVLKKDIENLSTEIAQTQKKFQQLQTQLHSTQQSQISLIQEAKNKDLEPYIQTHLDFIYKNIKEGNPMTTITLLKPSRNSQEKGMKNYASFSNVKGFVRSQSDAELKPSFHITKKTPLQIKTKQKVALKLGQKTQKTAQQRVWKDQTQGGQQKQKQKEIEEPNGSKPFVIRRSSNIASPQSEALRKDLDLIEKQNDQKENEKSTNVLGPKKNFRKSEHTEVQNEKNKQSVITEINTNSPSQEHAPEQENHSKPQFKLKKAAKQIANIPDEDLYLFPPGTDKTIKDTNLSKQQQKNSPKNTASKQAVKQPILSMNLKGPNLKLGGSKNSQENVEIKLSLQQNNQRTFLTNIQTTDKKSSDVEKSQPVQEEGGPNIGGRRQVQRKIQRKNEEDSYMK